MTDKPLYYDKNTKPIDFREWADLFEDKEYRIVRAEEIYGYLVSTVWFGLNSNFLLDFPLIFETMTFNLANRDDCEIINRYTTLEQAIVGHLETVELIKQKGYM